VNAPATPGRLEILPVAGIAEVTPGADLAGVIAGAAPWLAEGDVLVVTSKIVSKAEGRLVPVPADGPERQAARDKVLAAESARPVAARGATRIVATHHGFVLASAGIDASNVDPGHLVLLPVDPDASARRLRADLRARLGVDVAVVVTDTMGRPWRLGLTDLAIGAAGLAVLRDHRGERDAHGNPLHLTQMAVADELAGAAELVKGKHDQVPVAVVRGLAGWVTPDDGDGAAALVRGPEADLFPLGSAEARAGGLRAAADLPGPLRPPPPGDLFAARPVEPGLLDEVLATAGAAVTLTPVPAEGAGTWLAAAAPGQPLACAAAGARIQAVRAACAAAGLDSVWLAPARDGARPTPEQDADGGAGAVALGLLGIGWPAG
jgi:coenzyme F420-0:L-glutamate ligase/coenzyme F420-1:gamma-L-glutamate ligase